MAVIVQVLNGTNQCRDAGFQAEKSTLLIEGVRKGYLNEMEVTTSQVDSGMCFVEVTRDAVTPNEVFLIPVWVTVPTVVDTTGNGYIIVRVLKTKVNDGSANASDGSGIATVEKVATLVGITDDYLVLATLASGVITDARVWAQISENVLDDPLYYDEDLGSTDAYVISINGVYEYKDGAEYHFKANTNNVGAATLNVNVLGAKSIRKDYNSPLDDNDIVAGQIVVVIYDADNDWLQMQSPLANSPTVLVLASQAEAEAGSNNTKYLTPLRVVQLNDALYLTQAEAAAVLSKAHTHTRYNGVSSRAINAASSTQNIAHGLGVIPKRIRVTALLVPALGGFGVCIAIGTWSGSSGASGVYCTDVVTGTNGGGGATFTLKDTSSTDQTATISADATNIILTWTKTGSTANATFIQLLLEAEAES